MSTPQVGPVLMAALTRGTWCSFNFCSQQRYNKKVVII